MFSSLAGLTWTMMREAVCGPFATLTANPDERLSSQGVKAARKTTTGR
jgi:hypothetical protein